MNIREAIVRAEELRSRVDRLMEGVRHEHDQEHWLYEVEMCHDAVLRAFLAGLLRTSLVTGCPTVWSLLENCAPPELLADPRIQQERDYLSRPLAGTVTELLMRIRLLHNAGPWAGLDRAIRDRQTPEQSQVLLLVEMALKR